MLQIQGQLQAARGAVGRVRTPLSAVRMRARELGGCAGSSSWAAEIVSMKWMVSRAPPQQAGVRGVSSGR